MTTEMQDISVKRLTIGSPEVTPIEAISHEAFEGLTALGGLVRDGKVVLSPEAEVLRSNFSSRTQEAHQQLSDKLDELRRRLSEVRTVYEQPGPDAAEAARRGIKALYAEIEKQLKIVSELLTALQSVNGTLRQAVPDADAAQRERVQISFSKAQQYLSSFSRNLHAMKDSLLPVRQTYGFDISR